MTDDTEPRVRDALSALAARGGAPDEHEAWERITAAIDATGRSAHRRRAMLAVAGLAVAGSAAAAVVGLAMTDDGERQSVRVVAPASTPTTDRPPSTEPPVTDSDVDTVPSVPPDTGTTGTVVLTPQPTAATGPVPAHPLAAVVVDEAVGATTIEVHDADTGELLGTPAGWTGFGYSDASIAADGTLWFEEELGDSSQVVRVAWGSTEKEVPFGTETGSPALSPDGRTLAYVHRGITVERQSVRFVDLATGAQTGELFWADDEADFFNVRGRVGNLEWSPDGSRLLFVSSYEDAAAYLLDPATAGTLSDATPLAGGTTVKSHWVGDDRVVVLGTCCYVEYESSRALLYEVGGGEPTELSVPGRPVAVDGRPDGTIAVLTDDGVLHVVDGPSLELPGAVDFTF
jgi:hypothetical protein